MVPLRASRSVFLPLWNNVDYSGEVWMEAPATDKEGAGQEAEEEPEEGTYVFIKKNITSNKPADFKTGSALNFRFKDS